MVKRKQTDRKKEERINQANGNKIKFRQEKGEMLHTRQEIEEKGGCGKLLDGPVSRHIPGDSGQGKPGKKTKSSQRGVVKNC